MFSLRPIIFNYSSNRNYEANFTLATLADESMISQNSTLSSHPNILNRHNSQFNNSSRIENERTFNRSNIMLEPANNNLKSNKNDRSNKGNKQVDFQVVV